MKLMFFKNMKVLYHLCAAGEIQYREEGFLCFKALIVINVSPFRSVLNVFPLWRHACLKWSLNHACMSMCCDDFVLFSINMMYWHQFETSYGELFWLNFSRLFFKIMNRNWKVCESISRISTLISETIKILI